MKTKRWYQITDLFQYYLYFQTFWKTSCIAFYDFFDNDQLLYENQYGFRPKHSTYMALLKLINKVSEEIDDKFYSVDIFLDFV